MNETNVWTLIAIAAAAVLYGLHWLLSWAEGRGWIYYRKKHGSASALGNAFLELQSMIEPSKRHVIEEMRKDEADSEESGDPPESGSMPDA